MKESHLPTGTSDPVSYTCTCSASTSTGGLILLFYRYFSSPPCLPHSQLPLSADPQNLATFHNELTSRLNLGGKIRVAEEGFNITVGGIRDSISRYMDELMQHWSFVGLDLDSEEKRDAFFKPSRGCACAFDNCISVRITSEITPMGVTNYVPKDWGMVVSLSPEEFHEMCLRGKREGKGKGGDRNVLIDVRNHYESRIGYFVDPRTGEPALRPGIRRFSQWPLFVRRCLVGEGENGKSILDDVDLRTVNGDGEDGEQEPASRGRNILTYCTGGIRCEKGARFLQESLHSTSFDPSSSLNAQDKVFTLTGGIAAYLTWLSTEISSGCKTPSDSLFKGRNYVFDARGSTGLTPLNPHPHPNPIFSSPSNPDGKDKRADDLEPVANCHICDKKEDRMSKCCSKGCHLILVICEECERGDPRCCGSCWEFDVQRSREEGEGEKERVRMGSRPICECEREREAKLWGLKGEKAKMPKQKNKARRIKSAFGGVNVVDIHIKMIE